ncbi:nucleoside diphosphate-sugar hydrolase of the mutt family [Colletotrichum godetiae]|uniref:Nucleoside diphosphate-sugar hydrolase of the mutt family n=1 Tax=Colletotrichum godetiae TaxID=1209918 RepID=A0AAJ0AD51_9PEZI|nr:nucleoside diphosphate-sugar hydrolase of the mutt family [Colletotrichum godetiae]KAK1658720.1 nucleoside diphosphate-sugar hydrolase of the mutt family [Colletotrichum godetiae]
MTLVKINYRDVDGKERVWEGVERKTRAAGSSVDAVHIIAVIKKDTGLELLLQRQFRPAVGKVCIELPAGLIDKNETVEQCAVRELAEETGYVGTVKPNPGNRRKLYGAPGFSNSCSVMIHVDIDMGAKENRNPKPRLEEGEFIECFSLPLDSLHVELERLEIDGFAIDGRLGSLVEGLQMSQTWQAYD